MVIVDTSVWVEFLLRPQTPAGEEMARLLRANQVLMVGIVYAEVLQGASNQERFDSLGRLIGAIPFASTTKSTWRKAAQLSFELRRRGSTTALSDLVIAAQAMEEGHSVFALDTDFERVSGLRLHEVRS